MSTFVRVAIVVGAMAAAGCGIGESGIAPPANRIFFPTGMLVDPTGNWLYVVNSNADLRYNAGTLVALDLRKAAEDRMQGVGAPHCPVTHHQPRLSDPERFCCRDVLDDRILDCDERGYIDANASVRIGSFGGEMTSQAYLRGAESVLRLFVAVRAEPSITFIDVTGRDGRLQLRCTGDRTGGDQASYATCEDEWKVKGVTDDRGRRLQEEPQSLVVDSALGILYVGHLGGVERGIFAVRGVSVIDICAPQSLEPPRVVSVLANAFPGGRGAGVTSLTLANPGDPMGTLFATSQGSFEVSELAVRGGSVAACTSDATAAITARDLTLVPGRRFLSTAFSPHGEDLRGLDLRGFVLSPDGRWAYILHRNTGRFDPAALAIIDRRPDERGDPLNIPTAVLEVCPGPTELRMHDAGRGHQLFVTCFEGGQIYVIDPSVPSVTAIIEAGNGPTALAFSPADPTIAFVAGFADNDVAVIDLAPGSPTEYRVVQRFGFPRSANLSQ